eukprot:jgi/Psemu1/12436/gm1.12436_g
MASASQPPAATIGEHSEDPEQEPQKQDRHHQHHQQQKQVGAPPQLPAATTTNRPDASSPASTNTNTSTPIRTPRRTRRRSANNNKRDNDSDNDNDNTADPLEVALSPSVRRYLASIRITTAAQLLLARTTDVAGPLPDWRREQGMAELRGRTGALSSVSVWKKRVRKRAAAVGARGLAAVNVGTNAKLPVQLQPEGGDKPQVQEETQPQKQAKAQAATQHQRGNGNNKRTGTGTGTGDGLDDREIAGFGRKDPRLTG